MSKISQATKAKRDQDAFFIKLVQESKDLLLTKFGAPGSTKTNEAKTKKWEEIRDKCIANGNTKMEGKSADYIRDTSWGVFKSRTLRKYDELKKTGAAGGKFTEVSILLGCFNGSYAFFLQGAAKKPQF